MNVLHIVPRSVLDHEQQGAYKDVLSRIRWLDKHAESYHRLAVDEDDPGIASRWAREPSPTHILVEYSRFPRLVARLREIHPHARMLVRTHNIEPLQHLDNVWWGSPRGNFWLLYGMWRLFRQDGACARQADVAIGGIGEGNIGRLAGSGIAGIAVISALFSPAGGTVREAARKLKTLADTVCKREAE